MRVASFGLLCVLACAGRAEPLTLRVLSYNIHHGEGTDGNIDLARIAGVITATKPDVVALQEVDRNTTRTRKVDQAAELARLTGLTVEFGKAIDLQGGEYGQAILSRHPIRAFKVHPLPGKPGQEARIAIEARIEFGGGRPPLTFVGTHFQHNDAATRAEQAAKVNALFGDASGPTVLAGDLNATPDSPPITALAAKWSLCSGKGLFTFPADGPRRQIDYILYRPANRFRATEVRAIDEKVASDHRPILAVLELN